MPCTLRFRRWSMCLPGRLHAHVFEPHRPRFVSDGAWAGHGRGACCAYAGKQSQPTSSIHWCMLQAKDRGIVGSDQQRRK